MNRLPGRISLSGGILFPDACKSFARAGNGDRGGGGEGGGGAGGGGFFDKNTKWVNTIVKDLSSHFIMPVNSNYSNFLRFEFSKTFRNSRKLRSLFIAATNFPPAHLRKLSHLDFILR